MISAGRFTTLDTRRNLRRVPSRSRLWDRHWGQYSFSSFVLSPETVPQASARSDLPQVKFLPLSKVANRPFYAVYLVLKETYRFGGGFVFVCGEKKISDVFKLIH